MSNPQGPGKQGRRDANAKAPQPHHQAAASAPGRSEQHQPGHSPRPQGEQSHVQQRPGSSHPSQSMKEATEDE
jgi:hypothetical protein